MPLMRRLDPETAHDLALRGLRWGLAGADRTADDPILAVQAFGRSLRNPIGLAAGFDKNAVAVNALGRLGFGFVEAGTVTPRPQSGNPRPRLFRLPEDQAVINRMGFNNGGIDAYLANLRRSDRARCALGANVGINKEGADRSGIIRRWFPPSRRYADYVTVNISSPNTPGLRDLQGEARLSAILSAIVTDKPVFVKIAPDLAWDGLEAVIGVCLARGVSGLIVSNTTIARPADIARRGPDRDRRPLRRAAVRTVYRDAGPGLQAGREQIDADRRGRDFHGRGRAGENPRRGQPGAGLYRLRLSGPADDSETQGRPGAIAARPRLSRRSRTRWGLGI